MLSSNRRQFLALATSVAGVAASTTLWGADAADESARAFHSHYLPRPAIAAYSFRQHFRWSRGKAQQPQSPPIDMRGFIDFCAAHNAAAELTSYFFEPDIDDAEFLALKRYAFRSGVTICGTAIGNRFDERDGAALDQEIEEAKTWIDRAALLGAPHIRFFAGKANTLAEPDRFACSVAAVQQCAQHAAARGVMIGIENHGAITAETLLRFLDAVDSEWVGINLDTGNFPTRPYEQIQQCVERAVHVQWKVAIRDENGQHQPADFDRIAAILRAANYSGFVALEYEESGDAYQQTAASLQRMTEALT